MAMKLFLCLWCGFVSAASLEAELEMERSAEAKCVLQQGQSPKQTSVQEIREHGLTSKIRKKRNAAFPRWTKPLRDVGAWKDTLAMTEKEVEEGNSTSQAWQSWYPGWKCFYKLQRPNVNQNTEKLELWFSWAKNSGAGTWGAGEDEDCEAMGCPLSGPGCAWPKSKLWVLTPSTRKKQSRSFRDYVKGQSEGGSGNYHCHYNLHRWDQNRATRAEIPTLWFSWFRLDNKQGSWPGPLSREVCESMHCPWHGNSCEWPRTKPWAMTHAGTKSVNTMQEIVGSHRYPSRRRTEDSDAKPWPNVHLATLGYNLYYGDPFPILSPKTDLAVHQNIMDPGLRKPLFVVEYSQGRKTSDKRHAQPDGYHATVDMGCSTSFTTKTIRDEYEYQSDQQQTIGLSARLEAAIKFPPSPEKPDPTKLKFGLSAKVFARAGGTLSKQFRDIQSQNTLRNQKMYRTAAKCSSYVVAFNYAKPPKAHPDFQQAVDNLRSSESYYKLFDEYGTHFQTAVRMGARHGSSMFVDNSTEEEMQKFANGNKVSLDLSVGAVAKASIGYSPSQSGGIKAVFKNERKIPLITPEEKVLAQKFKSLVDSSSTISVIGPPLPKEGVAMWMKEVKKIPVPIQWESAPICRHPSLLSDEIKHESCNRYIESYCDEHLKKKGGECVPASEKECYNDLDCKDDFVCRWGNCIAVPMCKVILYRAVNYGGGSYTLETVTAIKHMGGRRFDLTNGNWYDSISSFSMSDGCLKVEAVDDDGHCSLGKVENGRYTSSVRELPYDLDNDVCAMKVWAKQPQNTNVARLLGLDNTTAAEQKTWGGELSNALEETQIATSVAEGAQDMTKNGRALKAVEDIEEFDSSVSRLQATIYLRNIGKAMYGYNHYFGAPSSSENAGTDPGFVHRPVWKSSYTRGTVVTVKSFDAIPKGDTATSGNDIDDTAQIVAEKVPDGWQVKKAAQIVCDNRFVTREIKSQYDYMHDEAFSLNPFNFKLDLGFLAFSLSSEFTEFSKSNSKSRKAMYKTSAECMAYIADLDLDNPPPTSDSLQFVVDAASDEHNFHSVFDMFGLHFPTKLIFGAKYGFTQMVDESSWSQIKKHSETFSVGAEATAGIRKWKGVGVDLEANLGATAGVGYGEQGSEDESQTFDSNFSEVKEFVLGGAMPNKGGVGEWAKIVRREPMPIRYGLRPICEHPVFASKKADCTKYSKTYCANHLQKAMGGGVLCDRPEKSECLWDMDCPRHYTCSEENTCVEEPSCTVWLYANPGFGGKVRSFGPLYHSDAQTGKNYKTLDMTEVDSVKISGGCEEVLLMDNDRPGCLEHRDDNILIDNRNGNGEKTIPDLPYDLEDDICAIKLWAKEKWA